MKLIRIETTPNPRARKLIVEPAPGSIRSYFNAGEARGDPLAAALFAIPGITNVLVHTSFISIVADAGADWSTLARRIGATLSATDEH